ncbi:hypothetical protein Droror1_Dr00008637 [Drosera rotundifolia]
MYADRSFPRFPSSGFQVNEGSSSAQMTPLGSFLRMHPVTTPPARQSMPTSSSGDDGDSGDNNEETPHLGRGWRKKYKKQCLTSKLRVKVKRFFG